MFFATQGGGKARMEGKRYVFTEAPPNQADLEVGDEVPEEWGIEGPFYEEDEQFAKEKGELLMVQRDIDNMDDRLRKHLEGIRGDDFPYNK